MSESVDGQMHTKNLQKIKSLAMNFLIHHQPAKENHVLSVQRNILNLSGKTPPDIIYRERTPISIFLLTEQSLVHPLVLIDSVFQAIWMKPLISLKKL